MPEISRFFGLVIAMFYSDRPPPVSTFGTANNRRSSGSIRRRSWRGSSVLVRQALRSNGRCSTWISFGPTGNAREGMKSCRASLPWSSEMLVDVVSSHVCGPDTLMIAFSDGAEGAVRVRDLVEYTGVFAPLADPAYFARAHVHPELGVVAWPNGADLDTQVLHRLVTRRATSESP